jgi:protein phosphatase
MPRALSHLQPSSAGSTDVGRQRKHNEDHLLVEPRLALFAVADGMGGHNAGEVASALAAKSVQNFFQATANGDGAPEAPPLAEQERALSPAAQRLSTCVRKANRDVFEISSTVAQHRGMGSTIVAAHFEADANALHVAHVGDSRAYRVRGGHIDQLTRDHSLVNDALEMKPDLSPKELARLPRNIITRALGMTAEVKVDVRSVDVERGDVYLLCSDGLTGMVSDEQILDVVTMTDDLDELCELLIALANDAGGTDNITVLVLRFSEAPDATPEHVTSPSNGRLQGIVSAEQARVLEAGGEVELATATVDVTTTEQACTRCGYPLIEGNAFCVECGLRIDGEG